MGDDRHDDRGDDRREGERGRGGPEGTEFLQLEISRWLESEARSRGDDVVRELLVAAIRTRLEERLGDRLRALGAAIADEIADDLEANLEIEERIDARRDARKTAVERAQQVLRDRSPEGRGGKKKR